MKTEKFITSLFMLNIILAVILVYTMKSDGIIAVFEDIFYSKKVSAGYMTFSPELLGNSFKRDTEADKNDGYNRIFTETNIKRRYLTGISNIPPVERAGLIIKIMGNSGDGNCLNGQDIVSKIKLTEHRKGCSEDFAEVFSVLAGYTGLDTRLVKNSNHYGVEIFDGKKWFFTDPYYAVIPFDDNSRPLSFTNMADRISRNRHIRLECVGGSDHCLAGKPSESHPYFSDRAAFASVYALMGNNIFGILKKEAITPLKPEFVYTFAPYREVKPHWAHLITDMENTDHLRKIVTGFMMLWIALFLAADVALPVYFVYSKFSSKKK
ncbi:hypothetical protein [Sphaerochaeta sp.]|uniref:hypothetical protein n=1 Tax=Sphaerochaeta sp. TaxID=1972642 RepID=UPI003D140A1B